MKKWIIVLAVVLFARENPFELPSSSVSEQVSQSSRSSEQAVIVHSVSKSIQTATSSSASSASSLRSKPVADLGFIAFYQQDGRLLIQTNDPLIKSFLVHSPTKGVFDFRAKRRFATKTIELQGEFFRSITLGAHKNHYRVVVEVSKKCKPAIEATQLICR